ncbi:MAG TPA: YciC family protein [Candidatus Melainabacteria bacterium]|nr:YciC family protein [Candidatus Melainabacteria bacterium]
MTQEIVPTPKTDEKFAVDDVISTGWQITMSRFWPLICILGVNGLVAALVPLASFVMGYNGTMTMSNIGLQLLMHFISAIIVLTVEIGMMNVFLLALDGQKVNADDCFKCIKFLPTYFAFVFLSRILIVLGYISFIVPGIILQISFQFAGYFILEKKMGPIAAMKASWAICEGARWQLILLALISYFINAVGFMCLLVGGIPAYLINGIANAATYRTLLANTPQFAEAIAPASLPDLQEP